MACIQGRILTEKCPYLQNVRAGCQGQKKKKQGRMREGESIKCKKACRNEPVKFGENDGQKMQNIFLNK